MRKRLRKHAHQARPFNAFHLIKITKLNCNFNQKMKRERKINKMTTKMDIVQHWNRWTEFAFFNQNRFARKKARDFVSEFHSIYGITIFFFPNNQTKLSIDCKSTWKIPIFTFLSCSFHVATLTQNRSHIITNTSHEYK